MCFRSVQKYDVNFHVGNLAIPHPQCYKNAVLKDNRAPDHCDLDVQAEVLPAAKKRGMKVICWLEDVFRTDLPNIEKLLERDLQQAECRDAVRQQSGLPEFPDRPSRGLCPFL
jgi:hypothetical protein